MKSTTTVCASFCGTGKTYLCEKYPDKYIELECWKYGAINFPKNYIEDIKSKIGRIEYIFISTNPIVLRQLYKEGVPVKLFYPENNLKNEYLKRYIKRGSVTDFTEMLSKHWHGWIDELKEQKHCEQIVLKSGEHIQSALGGFDK